MTLRPTIDKAGKYPVTQTPMPFQHGFFANLNAPPSGILHTTEGGWAGSVSVFKVHYAPHFLVGLNGSGKPEIAQLVPVGYGGLACVAHNNGARVEIEMIGYAKEELWLPDPETLDALASLMVVCRDEWGIPLSHPWPVGDYGRAGHNPHRSSGKFGSVAGWFGHADMPDPDTHWDPGNLNWPAIFAHAESLSTTPSETVHDVFWLQASLNALGADPRVQVDGDLGPETKAALMPWQFSQHLATTGVLDDATIKAMEVTLAGKA